ncbi:uncharacterized protein LOC132953292 [Metopolophium dirhodum]|uniref:uncharacterized protein LOC132937512 n=1 Tax=Metopolophium dirhodum TaxID=44670 RepID=UPI00298FC868|nr:uncharacterized protein LOC132937512 [Metopolophium dirhodum]XP_060881797.1 uncharacterized protein LOC132953292 [Metopolophium dirhodum]
MSTLVEGDKSSKPVCPLIGTRYSKNEHRYSSSDLCFISADLMKLRNTVSYIKHHLIDNKDTTDDKKIVVVSNYEMDNIFPIKSEDGLKMLENKLEDIEYFHKLVSTIAFTIGGIKSLSKMTTSTMRIMFSDEFIADYSWKWQKKKSLEASPIHKVIISRQYSYQLFFIIHNFNIYEQVSHP